MCARAASLSCRLSARRGSAGRFGSMPLLARTIFLAMMVGFTSAQTICTNTCSYANQGTCDDGGEGTEFTGSCAYGTDCADCGPRRETLRLCSSRCGACGDGYVTFPSLPGKYFYKTIWWYTCSACAGVVSGGKMHIYQAYVTPDTNGDVWNIYLWFDCDIGRWTISTAGEESETCPYEYACAGPYLAGEITDPAWSSCPYSGAPICPPSPPPPPDSDELIGLMSLIIIGVLLLVTFLCGGICVCLGVCVLRPICCRPNPNPGPDSRAGLEMREVTVQGYDIGRVVVGGVHSDSQG